MFRELQIVQFSSEELKSLQSQNEVEERIDHEVSGWMDRTALESIAWFKNNQWSGLTAASGAVGGARTGNSLITRRV